MVTCPSFLAELKAQMDLALQQERVAGDLGDTSAAEVASGRLADLRELLERNSEPLAEPA
ncbi:hypothetical protein CLV92_11465 [Kineococcus xinjiangensis]|uniref:Uncharacterized protein n=1 Tax=Kineococcus xinjiangensis TaxID=512762 RepID=A0A2S6IE15_9ACTN|nr:hypothetical protein [Kineococcus xinjiangensis]PPK92464.1 hypothetical protein CLV92_11465 [Kineococcus xinjiangensis]